MRTMLTVTFAALVFLAAGPTPAVAEKANMSPEAMLKISTHVVVGKVQRIYTTEEKKGNWKVTRYAAEVNVSRSEKGEGLAPGKIVFVRYWTQRWAGWGQAPPSTTGHRGLPKPGETLRIYLARDAYNGFGKGDQDGGYDVIGANGFERLKKK